MVKERVMSAYKAYPEKINLFLMLNVVLITICLLATPSHAQVIKSFQKIN